MTLLGHVPASVSFVLSSLPHIWEIGLAQCSDQSWGPGRSEPPCPWASHIPDAPEYMVVRVLGFVEVQIERQLTRLIRANKLGVSAMNKVMIMKHLVVPREQLGPTYQVISGRQLLPFVHRIKLMYR